MAKQNHTPEGRAEEFINEYDADDNQAGAHHRVVPARTPPVKNKKSFLTTLGKILSFLHR
jgi:hypothetical protein